MISIITKIRLKYPARGWSSLRVASLERWRICAFVLMTLLMLPGAVWAQTISWQDAVAELAAERTRAETCVRLLKRHAGEDAAALSHGELAYSEAKSEVDAVIAGLIVVLAQDGAPSSLSDLKGRLTQGVQAREAFCVEVTALVPDSEGTRNVIVALFGAVLGPLIEGLVKIYGIESEKAHEKDLLLLKTIQTQLEATKWAGFKDIEA